MTNDLEEKIKMILPTSSKPEIDPRIEQLTKEFIDGRYSTHSVCHLFEGYGRKCDEDSEGSYLYSEDPAQIAEELVNTTLTIAMNGNCFSCVDRIITPIMAYNLDHIGENETGFAFKPKILSDVNFIKAYGSYIKAHLSDDWARKELYGYQLEFCESSGIQDFFNKYVAGLKTVKKVQATQDEKDVLSGIFIDVDNTLIKYENFSGQFSPVKISLTHRYALKKLEEGIPVTVFTGGPLDEAMKKLRVANVDERLCNVKSKSDYLGRILDKCIDDTPPARQGLVANTYYDSGKIAWATEYSTIPEVEEKVVTKIEEVPVVAVPVISSKLELDQKVTYMAATPEITSKKSIWQRIFKR
jgi:hypothetical protein